MPSDVIFPNGTADITPASDDRVLLSDTSASGAASDAPLSALPISTATQTALDAKLDDSQLDTDGTLAANSDAKIASQKAVKTYVDTGLALKQATLVSGTNIKTVNGSTVLGSGDIVISGGGTVTDLSVVSANGLAGTVATSTTTPAITLSTTVTGLLKGNGTAISAAVSGTDYEPAKGADDNYVTDAEKIVIGNTSGTNTGDQTITLTGDVTGSGTGSFAATLANTAVTPGSYTLSSITVDSKGRITAASNGTAGTGDVVGPASATDSVPVLFNGTTGKLVKNSTPTGTGNPVLATSPTLVTPALGTPSSGTLTNCTGLPLAGVVDSTTEALGVGSLEVGHTTDTTISRVSAGVIAVEGATVPTLTSTSTFSTGIKTFLSGKFALRNVANTFNAFFTNTNTADRTYTLKDASGTLAFTSDITGTNSGVNTGDQTITLTGAVTGSGTGSFATTIATPGTLTVSSTNSTATAHTHAVTSSSAPGASASILATDASGHIGSTGTRIAKGWFTDLTVTNAISGSVTGNAATVTTNANLTGAVTSTGNATSLGSFTKSQLNTAVSDGDVAYLDSAAFTADITVPAEAYGAGWNGSNEVPTKNDVYDEMELHVGGNASKNIGYLNIPQNSQSAAYTTVLSDAGKHLYHPSSDTTARTFTIDSNANVAYPIGTAITFINDTSAGVMTIAITSDTLVLAGAGTTGSRTLAANGVATAIKITSTRWIISGTGLT